MLWKDAEFTFGAGDDYRIHIVGKRLRLRSNDLKSESGHGRNLGTRESLLVLFLDHIDAALHVEVPLGNFIVLAIENFFEAADGLRNRDVLAGRSRRLRPREMAG